MYINHLLVVATEPKSVFLEIFFKYIKSTDSKKLNKKITIIGNEKNIENEARLYRYNAKFNKINNIEKAKKNKINLINIKIYQINKKNNINRYILDCFNKSLSILKKNKNIALINGPIEKKKFLKKKYLGITEFLAKKTGSKNPVMLIYNKKISVSPITTHLPIKFVSKNLKEYKIKKNIKLINNFYIKNFKIRPKIAILGLNPHCETVERVGEEERIIIPAIKKLKKEKISIKGPFSADTFFIKKNIDTYDVVVGMYHDQVLTPLKTLFNFDAINVTIGLPFIRVSPDHGPNTEMYKKNKSDPASIFCAMEFFRNI